MKKDYIVEYKKIKALYYAGVVSYDEAKRMAAPFIQEMNEKTAEIAKQYGRRPFRFNFAQLMR